jgi:hypothetical protein
MFFFLLLVAGMLLRMTPGVRNALLNQEPFIMHIAPDANVFFFVLMLGHLQMIARRIIRGSARGSDCFMAAACMIPIF